MNKDHDREQALLELEEELGVNTWEIEPAPLRTQFQAELRSRLEGQLASPRKVPRIKAFFRNLSAKVKPAFRLPRFGTVFTGKRKLKLVASFALVAFMFTAVFYGLNQLGVFLNEPVMAAEITIKALEEDKMGIDPQAGFLLTSEQPLDEKTIKDTLRVSPAFSYDLKKGVGGKEFRIIPREKLADNTVYMLSFDTTGQEREAFSWAFQTKGSFRVLRSLPMTNSSHVPVETGIEVTFSHENYDLSKAQEYITISPQVAGRFEQHKKTLVFIPQKLQPATIYTVTVKKGFPLIGSSMGLAEDYSFSFETSPSQAEEDKFNFELDTRLEEFAIGEAPAYSVYFNRNTSGQIPQLEINIYKYADYKEFARTLAQRDEIPEWSYQARINFKADLSKLKRVSSYKNNFLSVGTYENYIVFQEPLPAGYYAAELKAGDCTRQVWFQVSNLATYLAMGEEKSLIWVNDLATQKPVAGARVEVIGQSASGRADDSGVAVLEFGYKSKEKTDPAYAWVSQGVQETVVPLVGNNPSVLANNVDVRDYWKYLYLERDLFKPGDELHFWGVLAPRSKDTPGIKEVQVELRGSRGPLYEGGEDSPIVSLTVPVTSKTYEGKIDLPMLKPDYYYLQVKTGETVLKSRGFSVATYEKPAYELELTKNKEAIFTGEVVNFEVKAAFFEGTPVPGIGLDYHIFRDSGTVTTNDRGIARIPYTGKIYEEREYRPAYDHQYLSVSANLPEAGEITASDSVIVFGSKVYLKGEVSRQDEEVAIQASLFNVDLSKINAGEILSEKNFLAGVAGGVLVNGSVYQDVWTRVETGQRYDFINKKVVQDYYYEYSSKHISDFSVITDQEGKLSYAVTLDSQNSYYLVLTAEDSEGRENQLRLSIPGPGEPQYSNYKYYYFAQPEEGKQYLPGEEVVLTFMENDRPLAPEGKTILYFRGQKQIESYEVAESAEYKFIFKEQDIPNVSVWGVCFDGKVYQDGASRIVPFARESRQLSVEIGTDKEEYRPGETVSLNISVKDRENKPVRALVNLNLVDEAIYSMMDQHVDLLNSLYSDYINMYLHTRKSHYHPGFGGGAEQGGEGEGYRKDFNDTILFITLETNEEGKAETKFKLPDNLTSWRVTYQALTDGIEAGSGTAQIPVKLPFFVEVLTNSTYLQGDSPVVVLRSYGEKLEFQDPVSFKMKLITPGGEEITTSGQSSAFTAYDWKLPELHKGKYGVLVEAKSREFEDKIMKEFNVVESLLERSITENTLLEEDYNLRGFSDLQEPLTLVFSDYEKSQYLSGIYELIWQGGSRFEQQMASRMAKKLLAAYFPTEEAYFTEDDSDTLLRYQQYDGGIAILPYAESELYLTALAASCSPQELDRRAMAGYFYSVLEHDEGTDDHSAALWGLSALKEPVLLQVNAMLEEKDLAPEQKVNLALAMLDIGNGAKSEKVFTELLEGYGEDLGATMRINIGRDQDEIIKATTQMALLAARLDYPQKNKLYQYLLENQGKDILNLVEKVLILKYNLQYMYPQPVSFTYELNGQKTSKTLQGQETYKLIVLPEDIGNLKFSNVKGKVGLVTNYTTSYKAEDLKPQEDLSIKRSYLVEKKEVTTLNRTDLVEVTITYNIGDKAPAGSYEIVDILPSGLRYASNSFIQEKKFNKHLAYPTEVKGQKITFAAGKGNNKLVYYARVISPGEYVAEPPLLSHLMSNTVSILGDEKRLSIK